MRWWWWWLMMIKGRDSWFSVEHGTSICLQIYLFPNLKSLFFYFGVQAGRSYTLWSPSKYSLMMKRTNWWSRDWGHQWFGWEQSLEGRIRRMGPRACVGKPCPVSSQGSCKDLVEGKGKVGIWKIPIQMHIESHPCKISYVRFPWIKKTNFLSPHCWDGSSNFLVSLHRNCKALGS